MTGHQFKPGDTVRVLDAFSLDESLTGITGTVDQRSPLGGYIIVRLPHGTLAPMLDSELELITPAPTPDARLELAREVVDALYPSNDARREEPTSWPPQVWAVADALLAKGYAKTAAAAQ